MTTPPLSPKRVRASLYLGLVLAVLFAATGIVALAVGANLLMGLFLLVAGVAVSAVSVWQLVRLGRSAP